MMNTRDSTYIFYHPLKTWLSFITQDTLDAVVDISSLRIIIFVTFLLIPPKTKESRQIAFSQLSVYG